LNVLFVHPNFPGQFRRLAAALSKEQGLQIVTLGDESWMPPFNLSGVKHLSYLAPEPSGQTTHPYVRAFETGVRRGQQVVRTLLAHKHQGFEPDIIYIHPGWGDGLYLKDIFPNSIVIGLFEYYYHSRGADVGFDPEFPMTFNDLFRVRTMNTIQLYALESCDIRITPTAWQKSRYPAVYQPLLECLHEGVDTGQMQPDPSASFTLPNGTVVKSGDEVLTYVSRSLEPYRGFHCFIRALPEIMRNRPNCQVIIVGQDKAHYGPSPKQAESWREHYLNELNGQLDTDRLHFTGKLVFGDYLKVLQVSRAHIYLTYPFILSWSMLEAMSAGCLILGSNVPTVNEVIKHGYNGMLFPFFDKAALVSLATDALAQPQKYYAIRETARLTIQKQYDFNNIIYPHHLALLSRLREQQKIS
jgi:glycosyltransferase involved in cell wall biosynthesis